METQPSLTSQWVNVMIKVDLVDFYNFIRKQPNNRLVEATESQSCNPVGCVMVHYGKEVLELPQPFNCSFNLWMARPDLRQVDLAETESRDMAVFISKLCSAEVTNYGDVKKNLHLLKIPLRDRLLAWIINLLGIQR